MSHTDTPELQTPKGSMTIEKMLDLARSLRPIKKGQTKRKYGEEEQKLALAWVYGELGLSDICRMTGISVKNRASGYNFLAMALKKIIFENGISNSKPAKEAYENRRAE